MPQAHTSTAARAATPRVQDHADELAALSQRPLTDAQQQQARELAAAFDPLSSVATITFGREALQEITAFSDRVLDQVRSRDVGEAGDILEAMVSEMQACRFDQVKPDSLLSRLPLIGELFHTFGKFVSGFDSVKSRLDQLENRLKAQSLRLETDVVQLDELYDENLKLLEQLDLYIAAGKLKQDELEQQQIPALSAQAKNSGDPVDSQKLRDLQQVSGRLEKRLHNLLSARLAALQTAPQIRLSQEGNRMLMEDIQDIMHNSIPLWKRQFLIAISNYEKEKALKVTRTVKDYTNAQYVQNASRLQALEQQIAENYQRGVLDLESLQAVNRITIETLNSTLKHYQEGRRQRQQAQAQIAQAEQELKLALQQSL